MAATQLHAGALFAAHKKLASANHEPVGKESLVTTNGQIILVVHVLSYQLVAQ